LESFDRYFSSGEINTQVKDASKSIKLVRKKYENENEIDELDGLTVSSQKWWFNLRPSNTEPLLRLNVEADSPKLMAEIRDTVLSLI
jgi:phosphomannomutase